MKLKINRTMISDILEALENKNIQIFGMISNMQNLNNIHQISYIGFHHPSVRYISRVFETNESFNELHFHNYYIPYDNGINNINKFNMEYDGGEGIKDISRTSNAVAMIHNISQNFNYFSFSDNTGDYKFASWIHR